MIASTNAALAARKQEVLDAAPVPPFRRVSSPGTTPVPNVILDREMPRLRDSELRVLLAVVRATAGFRTSDGNNPTARKRRDWLSHRRLVFLTGRGSTAVSRAVSRAVETLAKRGLIVVEDGAGNPLPTAGERRRYLGKLYYRLCDADANKR